MAEPSRNPRTIPQLMALKGTVKQDELNFPNLLLSQLLAQHRSQLFVQADRYHLLRARQDLAGAQFELAAELVTVVSWYRRREIKSFEGNPGVEYDEDALQQQVCPSAASASCGLSPDGLLHPTEHADS